jgi:ribosomal protein L12E/L44/L45/RPP1/RPP2
LLESREVGVVVASNPQGEREQEEDEEEDEEEEDDEEEDDEVCCRVRAEGGP